MINDRVFNLKSSGWRESGGRLNDRVRFESDGRESISLNEDKGKEKSDQRRGTDRTAVI